MLPLQACFYCSDTHQFKVCPEKKKLEDSFMITKYHLIFNTSFESALNVKTILLHILVNKSKDTNLLYVHHNKLYSAPEA